MKYDLVDFEDNLIKIGTKKEAKKLKLFTRSVHILILDRENNILLCKRSPNKKTYPNKITSSAGGHVEQGENYKTAALRELKEELNLTIKLKDLGRFDVVTSVERAIHHLFLGKLGNKKFSIDYNEITSCEFKSPKLIQRDLVLHSAKYSKPFHEAFQCYIKSTP
jgi:isopentenyldiphosphate isomerase